MRITDLSIKEFDEYISRDVSVVEFSTEWCGPCKQLASFLSKYESDLEIGRVDCDENGELCNRFEILYVPTIVLFSRGEEIIRIVGFDVMLTGQFLRVYEHLSSYIEDVDVVRRIVDFAGVNNLVVDINVLLHVLKYHGNRCPCRLDVNRCPCDDALESINKIGRCYCGLFFRGKEG